MNLPAILDAAAAKAAGIAGLAGASGVGVTPGVDPMPLEMPTTPYAIGYVGAGTAAVTTTLVRHDLTLEFRVYAPKSNLPPALAVLLAFPGRFEAAWRTGRSLGGACLDSWYAGHGRVDVETWGEVDYLVLPIRIGVLWTGAAEMSP